MTTRILTIATLPFNIRVTREAGLFIVDAGRPGTVNAVSFATESRDSAIRFARRLWNEIAKTGKIPAVDTWEV